MAAVPVSSGSVKSTYQLSHTHTHTDIVKHTECIYNPLTHHPHTDTVSAVKEMILNLQEGYQIALRNKKKCQPRMKTRALGQ